MIAGILVSYEPEAQTLSSTFASLLPQLEHLFLVDNGSSIDPADLLDLKSEERLTIIRLDENLGIAAAQNVGIAAAREMGADFVVLSDQDTVYPQGAMSQLIDVFERWPKAAAVTFSSAGKSASARGCSLGIRLTIAEVTLGEGTNTSAGTSNSILVSANQLLRTANRP